ncbi:hypothetical protein AG1IA_02994 [Rhizoctonia solani AG-1 IA]|uniref:Uncharacterized protein n=1 Tax=Thanatephorus cucumeris (strain AG1-IA) TaxID=983506 RepID=L8X1K6_THACA|nr:hypothetical protein AG1IA_02994 [Rhizoctonia solani AG-1 IA]
MSYKKHPTLEKLNILDIIMQRLYMAYCLAQPQSSVLAGLGGKTGPSYIGKHPWHHYDESQEPMAARKRATGWGHYPNYSRLQVSEAKACGDRNPAKEH